MAERKSNKLDEPLHSNSGEPLSDSPTNDAVRRRRSTSTPRAKKTKERSEEKARQTARPVSPTWEDIDEERPRRKSRADPAQRANTSTRRIKTISSSQLGTVREESTGVAQDSLRFFPKLSRILENKEAAPPRRRSSGSVTSSSERSLHSIRANRSDSFDSREVAERRASRHKRRAHQRRAELLMNPSMLSVVSGTTNSSGTSSGSGSTITQKSYDKSANERRRSGEHSRHPRSRRERSSSPSGTKSSNKPSMDRSNVFAYMVPDVPGENIEGYQASSSSSAYAGSDAGSSHTPATSVTSSSPSPTMNRRRFVGDRWSVPEKAASDGNASARGSSSERSQRSRHDQRLSSTRDISEPEQYDPKKSELRKDTDTSAPTEDIPYDERADYLGHQYDEALRHQRLHDQAAVQAYYQQLESYPRYPIPRVHDEYGDAATGYYNAPPPVPEAPSHRPPMTSSYQHHTPDHPARFHKTRHIPAPADPHKVTVVGYEALAVKLSSTDQSDADGELRPIYRKFEHLNHRVLLHLQDEISELEEDLRKLDECIAQASAKAAGKGKSLPASRRAEAKAGTEAHHRRIEVLGKIYVKIGQYNQAFSSYQSMLQSASPAYPSDIETYKAWLAQHKPLVEPETRFLGSPGDLLALTTRSRRAATARTVDTETRPSLAIFVLPLALIIPLAAFSIVPGMWGRLFVLALVATTGAATLQQSHGVATTAGGVGAESDERFGKEWIIAGAVYFATMVTLAAIL